MVLCAGGWRGQVTARSGRSLGWGAPVWQSCRGRSGARAPSGGGSVLAAGRETPLGAVGRSAPSAGVARGHRCGSPGVRGCFGRFSVSFPDV